jgi:DNA polymerase III epsilon subunit-like protein
MITNNGNIICACDVETTGLDPEEHEIWQLACIPLTFNLEQDKTRPVLELFIRPDILDTHDHRELALTETQIKMLESTGFSPAEAIEQFDRWFEQLKLQEGRRIIPLAQNWKFDHQYMQQLLGYDHYNYLFDGMHRDTLAAALFVNDMAEFLGEPVPFSRTNLSVLCQKLGVKLDNAHDALADSYATVDVYKKLLAMVDFR